MKYYKKLNEENRELKIITRYELGGYNNFTGQESRRGFYISFNPIDVEKCDGYRTETSVVFGAGNYKVLIKETKRDNKKLLYKIDLLVEKYIDELCAAHAENSRFKIFEIIEKINNEL